MLAMRTKTALTRKGMAGQRCISTGFRESSSSTTDHKGAAAKREKGTAGINKKPANVRTTSVWVPHPRNGIYFPEGYDGVIDEVPKHAALPSKSYWLRNVDGVERPDPDLTTDHYLHAASHVTRM